MSSSSQVIKDRFQAQLESLLARSLEGIEENVYNADILIIRKCYCVIPDCKKKSICDYYFNIFNRKL